MNLWNRRATWERRRRERKPMKTDPLSIINAVAAWLNGNERHALAEGYTIESATVSDATLVVTLQPLEEGKVDFRVMFKLTAIESETFSRFRHSQSDRKGDA